MNSASHHTPSPADITVESFDGWALDPAAVVLVSTCVCEDASA